MAVRAAPTGALTDMTITFFILLAWCLLPLFIPVVIDNPFAGGGVESRHAGREVLPDSKTCGDYPVNPYGESSRGSVRPARNPFLRRASTPILPYTRGATVCFSQGGKS